MSELHSVSLEEFLNIQRAEIAQLRAENARLVSEVESKMVAFRKLAQTNEKHYADSCKYLQGFTLAQRECEELKITLHSHRTALVDCRDALDVIWDELECGWITDGDPDSSYCECGECGAKQVNSKEGVIHMEECVQGKIHYALTSANSVLK